MTGTTQNSRSMVVEAFRVLNAPEAILPRDPIMVLCDGPPRGLFVLDPTIAGALLRSPLVVPTSGQRYYEVVSGLTREDFPVLSEALDRTPLSLNGNAHREARAKLTPLYRRVETKLELWIEGFCAEYLLDLRTRSRPDLVEAASDFSDRVSRGMAAAELGIHWQDLPPVPNEIFMLFPSATRLRDIEAKFSAIQQTVALRLKDEARDEEEFWPILTLMMMNRDAMQGTLMHLFSQLQGGLAPGSSGELALAATSVSLLQGREIIADCEIAGRTWRAGDVLYIAPYLLHRRDPPPKGIDFTFGAGPHACPGRKLSLRILDALITALRRDPLTERFFPHTPKLYRQIVLTAKP